MSETAAKPLPRRLFLAGALMSSAAGAAPSGPQYRIITRQCEIRCSIEFHDNYSAPGLVLTDAAGRHCLSEKGERNRNCARKFVGALAIVQYRIETAGPSALREHVRTIDRDHRLDDRPPYHRTIAFSRGVVSDIQAFGYDHGPAPEQTPWYYFRQDLFLDQEKSPFMVVHWKHALPAIRLLDLIPGEGTILHETPRR